MFAAVLSFHAPSAERMCEDKINMSKGSGGVRGGRPKGIIYILCIHEHIVGLTAPPPPQRETQGAL
jgi:hypothetical protein